MKMFHKDISEKKRIAASAKKKYRPRRVPQINNYTELECYGMNGPVKTYGLNLPKTWAEFKEMPVDVQTEYVTKLIKQYEIGPSALSEMFGVANPTCSKYIKQTLGIAVDGRSSAKKREKFLKAMQRREQKAQNSQDKDEQSAHEDHEQIVDQRLPEKLPIVRPTSMQMQEVTMHFSGPYSSTDIANSLAVLYEPGVNVSVSIEIVRIDDEKGASEDYGND